MFRKLSAKISLSAKRSGPTSEIWRSGPAWIHERKKEGISSDRFYMFLWKRAWLYLPQSNYDADKIISRNALYSATLFNARYPGATHNLFAITVRWAAFSHSLINSYCDNPPDAPTYYSSQVQQFAKILQHHGAWRELLVQSREFFVTYLRRYLRRSVEI